jgi:hypothetical protein
MGRPNVGLITAAERIEFRLCARKGSEVCPSVCPRPERQVSESLAQ